VLHARAAQSGDQLTSHRATAVLSSLQRMILELRMVPVSTALDRVARLVRDASRAAGKEIDFEVEGGDIELDQAVLDAMVDPLVHLLRNAVDHGIEPPDRRESAGKSRRGRIRIEVSRERNSVRMLVIDDGRGVDTEAVERRGREVGLLEPEAAVGSADEILRLLFQPGFSTAQAVTELSGRGVGLDVVAGRIRGLGGAIELSTASGEGTTFTLRVPITLALAHALRIGVGEEEYALPITHVKEVVPLDGANRDAAQRGTLMVRDVAVSLVDLGRVLGSGSGSPSAAVVAELGERRVAVAVDRVIGHEQIVVKPFDAPVGTLPVFSGATILPDGRPALLIDPLSVL
jgi:two-component system chemotaxis sensor kinase CheA